MKKGPSTVFQKKIDEIRRYKLAYLLITPACFIGFLVLIFPLLDAIYLSFFNVRIRGVNTFVGLKNYVDFFQSDWSLAALKNTTVWTVCSTGGQFLLGLAAALLLNQPIKVRGLFRGIALIPWVTPAVAATATFSWILNDQFGIVNYILLSLGIIKEPVLWLGISLAMPTVILTNIWKGFPFVMVILLAGLQGIDKAYYEAAEVDGATVWQKFSYITIPQLKPMINVAVLLSAIWNFRYFTLIFTMTEGGPGTATEVLVTLQYKNAFKYLTLGYGSAIGIVIFAFVLVFTLLYYRTLKETIKF